MFRYRKYFPYNTDFASTMHRLTLRVIWTIFSNNKHKIFNYQRTRQHTKLINMSCNSDFDTISNEGLLV